MRPGRRLVNWLGRNAANLLATLSLAGIGAGFWLVHPGLGLIVPSAVVFGCLVLGRLRG
jgi:hypothetical protein